MISQSRFVKGIEDQQSVACTISMQGIDSRDLERTALIYISGMEGGVNFDHVRLL